MRLRVLLVVPVLCLSFCGGTVWADLHQWSAADGGNDHWYGVVSCPSELSAEEIAAAVSWVGPEYAVIGSMGIGWHEASGVAYLRGGYLATIQSAGENDFIFSLVNDPKYWDGGAGPWFGGIQDVYSLEYQEPDAAWIWLTDYPTWQYEPMVYTNWYTLEPNNEGGYENVTHFCTEGASLTPSFYWNDRASNVPCDSFVVEYDVVPVPLPGSALLGLFSLGYAGMRLRRHT